MTTRCSIAEQGVAYIRPVRLVVLFTKKINLDMMYRAEGNFEDSVYLQIVVNFL